MSSRRSSAIGMSSSTERILRVRCTSVGRSSVSRFIGWLGRPAGDAMLELYRVFCVSASTVFCGSV